MKYLFHTIFLFTISLYSGFAQVIEPSSWEHTTSIKSAVVGQEIDLIFKATIDTNWYLYSSDFDPDCGPMVTAFTFVPNDSYALVGGIRAINPVEKFDDIFECTVRIFKKTGEFRQTIKLLKPDAFVSGNYEFQVCSDIDGKCIPFDYDFEFSALTKKNAQPVIAQPSEAEPSPKQNNQPEPEQATSTQEEAGQNDPTLVEPQLAEAYAPTQGPILTTEFEGEAEKDKSIVWFMVLAFIGGLAALVTPCVFPLIPMTVSFFTGKKRFQALLYGFSIVLIYTLVGSALAPIMGPETANHLATEWLPNVIFFIIFVIFALSFFGLFDITLPSNVVNAMDRKADRGGIIGVFFMAFTLVLVSFSCTGPIVGSILVSSAGGEFVKPIAGMFAFSMAFAIPFTLFAFFPGWLSSLPKSGGWLNTVKVLLGFVELALAFKFLSIADQAFHWGILDRDVNIAIWIVIFSLMGFYLLGKIRLPHDSHLEVVSVPRLMMAIGVFSFVIYLIPGLWGAPLKALAGYLPPMYTHDFNIVSKGIDDPSYKLCDEPKYADFLHFPHGLKGYFDYDQGLACARAQNKPVFIDFTGHGCTNCREMEAVVWSHPAVLDMLKDEFVLLALYVDDKTELPEEDWYTSPYDDKVKKTIGKQNADLQIRRLNNNAQPFYVLLGPDEQVLVPPVGYDKDVNGFLRFLKNGLEEYQSRYGTTVK